MEHLGQISLLNSRDGREQQGPTMDEPLPAARLRSVEGKHYELGRSPRHSQLVFFAATDCKPCQRLKPGFASLAGKYGSRVQPILVCRGTEGGVVKFATDLPSNVVVVADPRWDLGTRLRVYSTPFVIIADREGVVRGKGNPRDGAALESLIEH